MAEWTLSCFIQGEKFSPSQVEGKTSLSFSRKNEPGDIGTAGRYKSKPIPYGASELRAPEDASWEQKWNRVLEALEKHIATFRECGAESIVLHYLYCYDTQCNMEFTPDELRRLADLGIPFTISCYCADEVAPK